MRIIQVLIIWGFSCVIYAGSCVNKSTADCQSIPNYSVCCGAMGGINYCDSSGGRLVCNNGYVSSCYCSRFAVMDLQLLQGCCLWHGGEIHAQDENGLIICSDGSVSIECSEQNRFLPQW